MEQSYPVEAEIVDQVSWGTIAWRILRPGVLWLIVGGLLGTALSMLTLTFLLITGGWGKVNSVPVEIFFGFLALSLIPAVLHVVAKIGFFIFRAIPR